MRVPPGVSEKDFADAIREFEEVVGLDWVFTSDEDMDTYRDDYSVYKGEPEDRVSSAAVAPDNVEEVSKIVKIANTYRIPIYAISTGRNLGYGHCAPVYSGSVVLDLKRMNRIIEVNEKNAYVLVEPGVNYFDLYRYSEEKGVMLIDSMADNAFGGLVGNALEHGCGYLPPEYRDHFDSHCGMELVLANGEIMRTGEALFEMNKVYGELGAETGQREFLPSTFRLGTEFTGPRVFLIIFHFMLYADIEYNKKVRETYRAAAKLTAEHGWGEYRAHPSFYNEVMADFSYNNHSLMRLHETIKDAVDPNGILAAGRYGVWPKHLRHMKEVKSS